MNNTSTVSAAVAASNEANSVQGNAQPRKWTSEAGPIQTKKVNQALQNIRVEGQTHTEKWGIIGVDEKDMSFYSPYGGCRQEASEAMTAIAERFDYKATRENYQQIITAADAAVLELRKSRPVIKDTRKTPEQQAEIDARATKAAADRERARIVAEMPNAELGEVWVNCVVEFRDEIKAIADKAQKTIGEVFAMWRKYSDACSSSDQSAVMPEFLQIHKAELTPIPFVHVRHRGHLRELCEAGRLELVGSYHYDEMMGQRGHEGPAMPVRLMPDVRAERQEGICYVYPSDFEGKCGSMSQGKTGIVHLRVHSNCNYDFRVKPDETLPAGLPQDASESTGASGIVVRRNLAHNGVEIQFPGKPDGSTLARLKAAGFRWSFHSKVWYKKFGAYAWAQAHEIAGLPLALSGARVDEPDRFDMAVEDRMSEQCGLNGGQD